MILEQFHYFRSQSHKKHFSCKKFFVNETVLAEKKISSNSETGCLRVLCFRVMQCPVLRCLFDRIPTVLTFILGTIDIQPQGQIFLGVLGCLVPLFDFTRLGDESTYTSGSLNNEFTVTIRLVRSTLMP